MAYKKFEDSDLFYNTIKAKPRFQFKIWNGKAVVNDGSGVALLNNLQTAEPVALIQPSITPPTGCALPYSFDFSCEENSYYLSTI